MLLIYILVLFILGCHLRRSASEADLGRRLSDALEKARAKGYATTTITATTTTTTTTTNDDDDDDNANDNHVSDNDNNTNKAARKYEHQSPLSAPLGGLPHPPKRLRFLGRTGLSLTV